MKRNIFIALAVLGATGTLWAQNETQALRYSMINPFGTARFEAQGGANAALGGDLSAIYVNPAGLGMYRSAELSFSPSLYWVNTESNYQGKHVDDSRLRFNVGSLGYVSTSRNQGSAIKASFAIGYNTLANFNQRMTLSSPEGATNSSMLDEFVWRANEDPDNLSPFYEQVASDANLLPIDETGEYWNVIQDGGYGQTNTRYVEQTGYIGEYSLSGALSFSDLLYVGATMGIHSLNFSEDIYHTETDPGAQVANIDSYRFSELNSTSGWGYTMRLGMIIRPMQLLRFGATFQLPTYYRLTDEKYTSAASSWDLSSGFIDASATSPVGYYDYKLKSPMRMNAHASVILFKVATISAAYEWADYSTMRLDSNEDKFLEENMQVQTQFQDVHHLSTGAELRFGQLYLRGGFQYLNSPYTDSRNNTEQFIYSGGFGVRSHNAFLDLSLSRGNKSEVYSLYYPGDAYSESSYTSRNTVNPFNLMMTVGLKL